MSSPTWQEVIDFAIFAAMSDGGGEGHEPEAVRDAAEVALKRYEAVWDVIHGQTKGSLIPSGDEIPSARPSARRMRQHGPRPDDA